jgi:hypothetical protein
VDIMPSPFADPKTLRQPLESRLAAYIAAVATAGVTGALASDAQGDVVVNNTEQPFGINGSVGIDFNGDTQIDFEIDHDRVNLPGGSTVDYLQIDKNDTNGATLGENPLPINVFDTFPLNGTISNNTADAAYVIAGPQGSYPAALTAGTPIGPGSVFDFSEGDNFAGTGRTIRANRLIDEDAGQVDQVIGGLTAAMIQVPTNGPNFLGLGGEVRYVGLKMGLNDADVNYGWVGIRIDDEAEATGAVVGYGYETTPNTPIGAGVPEPTSMLLAGAMLGTFALRYRSRRADKKARRCR